MNDLKIHIITAVVFLLWLLVACLTSTDKYAGLYHRRR